MKFHEIALHEISRINFTYSYVVYVLVLRPHLTWRKVYETGTRVGGGDADGGLGAGAPCFSGHYGG